MGGSWILRKQDVSRTCCSRAVARRRHPRAERQGWTRSNCTASRGIGEWTTGNPVSMPCTAAVSQPAFIACSRSILLKSLVFPRPSTTFPFPMEAQFLPPPFAGVNKFCKVRCHPGGAGWGQAAMRKFERSVARRRATAAAFLWRQCMPASLQRAATSILQADSTRPDPMQ